MNGINSCCVHDHILGIARMRTASCGSGVEYRIERQEKTNCKTGKIIDSIAECQTASSLLGLSYVPAPFAFEGAPAGCHRYQYNSTDPNNKDLSMFNTILNPSSTKPSTFGSFIRAVCLCAGRFIKANT